MTIKELILGLKEIQVISSLYNYHKLLEGWIGVFILFIYSPSIHLLGTYYRLGSLLGVGDKVVRNVSFLISWKWPEVQ